MGPTNVCMRTIDRVSVQATKAPGQGRPVCKAAISECPTSRGRKGTEMSHRLLQLTVGMALGLSFVVGCIAGLPTSPTPDPSVTNTAEVQEAEPASAQATEGAEPARSAATAAASSVPSGEPVLFLENEYAIWISEREPAAEMTVEEVMQSWVGERVFFLPPAIEGLTLGEYSSNPGNHGCSVAWNEDPYDPYAGQTGVIVEARAGYEPELRIAMEGTGEEVVLCSSNGLGFFSELEFAQGLVGQELWTRKAEDLARICPSPQEVAVDHAAKSFKLDGFETTLPAVSRVSVTRVEWGIAVPGDSGLRAFAEIGERPIRLYFETDDGQEYCTYSSKQHFVDRFHPLVENTDYSGLENYMSDFYLEDPVLRHPDWSQDVWELIRNQEVAIGMDLEMALMAAGGKAYKMGIALRDGSAGTILLGSVYPRQAFVVDGDKVVEVE